MNTKLFRSVLWLVVLMAVSLTAFGQTHPTFTTLSAAITDERAARMSVTSATGFVASNSAAGLDYGAFIDTEFVRITGVTGTTITIQRGQVGTTATPHVSGATVFVGQYGAQNQSATQTGGPFIQSPLKGICTRAPGTFLPLIQVRPTTLGGQAMYDCLGGQWFKQTLVADQHAQSPGTIAKYCNIPVGPVAYASIGTDAASTAGSIYRGTLYVPYSHVVTGLAILNGTTVGTDAVIYALYDAGGVLMANTALAGATSAGADTFQTIAFTASRVITGPARYFIAFQVNGTTAAHQTVAASTYNDIVSSSATGTFGTLTNFTAPTTFTAGVSPVGCTY